MKQFHLTMMCYNCKTKISNALLASGYHDFDIDMGTGLLTFENDVIVKAVVKTVNKIGYRIVPIEEVSFDNSNFTEEDIYAYLYSDKK